MRADTFRETNAVARPPGIEEPFNVLLVHPIARWLLPIAVRLRIAPNAISISGIGFGVLAAGAFQHYDDRRFVLAGFAAMLGWHVFDGLDGMVARATGRASPFGRFLDGICDYTVFILVYCSLALAVTPAIGGFVAWTLAVAAGASHIVQAAYYEAQRERFIRRQAGIGAPMPRPAAGGGMEIAYNWLQGCLLGSASMSMLDSRLAAKPSWRHRYAAALEPLQRSANILAPTAHTLAIFIACLAGSPVYYWLWEIVVLGFALLCIEAIRRRKEAALID